MVPVVKKALTAAERQRKRREKLQREGKYDVYKVRHANYGKIYRRKQNGILESTTAEEQLKSVSVRREKDKERKKRSRERNEAEKRRQVLPLLRVQTKRHIAEIAL